jgi:hypothetical protein
MSNSVVKISIQLAMLYIYIYMAVFEARQRLSGKCAVARSLVKQNVNLSQMSCTRDSISYYRCIRSRLLPPLFIAVCACAADKQPWKNEDPLLFPCSWSYTCYCGNDTE